MKKIPIYLAAVVLLIGCSKRQESEQQPAGSDRIVFGSTIEVATKVVGETDKQFANGEKIGVLGYQSSTQGETTDFATPFFNLKDFTYNSSQNYFATTDPAAIWKKGKFHNFYAYYPSTLNLGTMGAAAPKVALTVGATGIDPTLDIMCAKSVATTAIGGAFPPAQLTFTHRLSKVKFRIVRNADVPASTLTKLEFKMGHSAGSLDIATGKVVDKTAGRIMLTNTSTVNIPTGTPVAVGSGWLVLPDDVVSGISVIVNGKPLTVTGEAATGATAAGQITAITIKLTNYNITYTGEIEAWGTKESIKDDLEPPTIVNIGDYCYADGSYSATYYPDKPLLGVVYRTDFYGTGMMVEVGDRSAAWGPDQTATQAKDPDNGLTNLATIKALTGGDLTTYPAFKHCEDKNGGGASLWYLPAKNELKALHAGYCGLRWMKTGADPVNGEIDDWEDEMHMPNGDNYTTHRVKFNNILRAAAGGVPFETLGTNWSSTERYDTYGVSVQLGTGYTQYPSKYVNERVRCVRAFSNR